MSTYYDTNEVAKPASAADLVRDANGFTNPNLHRRLHAVNGLPYLYAESVGLTWEQAAELNLSWENNAGEYPDYYESDYYVLKSEPDDFTTNYSHYYTRSGAGTEADPYVYTPLTRAETWQIDTYYAGNTIPVIDTVDGADGTYRSSTPIIVDDVRTIPESDIEQGAIYYSKSDGNYYWYVVDAYGLADWEIYEPVYDNPDDVDGVICRGRIISPINQRKIKKGSPSDYWLHIQDKDSYRRKSDNFVSGSEDQDNSHTEIP